MRAKNHVAAGAVVAVAVLVAIASSCHTLEPSGRASAGANASPTAAAASDPHHLDKVMQSKFCAGCHPDIYAEHEQNTHGRAFTDEEVRIATGRFDHGDCIRCHTPRPIFETGIGLNPMRRYHGLEEGNTCMTCHWKQGEDYTAFVGGAECKTAFDDRVGTVEACASCHRNHGTPYQWEVAPTGKAAGRTCMTCHMSTVRRPVAVGEPPRLVRSHVFPGARSETHVKKAYRYDARIEGDHVVVAIENKGAGHHFPTELKQRSVESLVIVKDTSGAEVARSRMVFRDPYKRPYGLNLPVNTQIPPGQTREHKVPIGVAGGTVVCELHFKYYFPIEDYHPELARRLEHVELEFQDVVPSTEEVVSEPGAKSATAEGIDPKLAGVANLVDYMRPKIAAVEVPFPEGTGADDIAKLIELFQWPVPEGNRIAQQKLKAIGLPAVPALIEALGSWDNKTFHQASDVLEAIGAPAVPAVLDALDSDQLYIRYHAREIVAGTDPGAFLGASGDAAMRARVAKSLQKGCASDQALDRRSALEAAASLRLAELHADAARLLADRDPDVVAAAAQCLAATATPAQAAADAAAIARAMRDAFYPETRTSLATAVSELGSGDGVPVLLDGLDHPDDLLREDAFEALFQVTGTWEGYDPAAPRPDRLAAIARLRDWWAREGGPKALRKAEVVRADVDAKAFGLIDKIADGRSDDQKLVAELVEMGTTAVPALVRGLKFPAGFADRRARVCETLGKIGSPDAAPALAATLRDPVVAVAAWACFALGTAGDPAAVPALKRYRDRLLTLNAAGHVPAGLDFATLLAQCEKVIGQFE